MERRELTMKEEIMKREMEESSRDILVNCGTIEGFNYNSIYDPAGLRLEDSFPIFLSSNGIGKYLDYLVSPENENGVFII